MIFYISVVIYTHNPYGGGQLSEENCSVLDTTFHTIIGESGLQVTSVTSLLSPFTNVKQSYGDSIPCGSIVADKLVKMITDINLNISSPYPLGTQQLHLSQITTNKRGVEAFQQGQYYKAIAIWHKALKIADADNTIINTADYASILFNKARAYEKLGCLYLAQIGYDEVLIKEPHYTKAKESLKTDEKLLENLKLETVRNSVQQFIALEGQSNNEIKISILKEIEQIEYGTLVKQFAYKKTAKEVKNLVII